MKNTISLPGDIQLRADIRSCLSDAMVENFPITATAITDTTVPSKPPIVADAQGWGICLAKFAELLHDLRPVYAFYTHQPIYTEETLAKALSDILVYLENAIIKQAQE